MSDARSNSLLQGKNRIFRANMNGNMDTLWMTELEVVFGLPLHYTDTGNLHFSKRQQLLGRAWSVPVVKHILQPLKFYFKCEGQKSVKWGKNDHTKQLE
ncbi:DNA (cytosine-5)-methyltransferase 3B [Zootermopsis nevadensis]|uniref:DNA (Cytosine-5)-methyltransferase 3B n=1 Tax=Zootermopsis nevadensis TaxID=136037 RepID=A0A067QJJ4_ZOONE|nr:DNA (cytosine-5)-methyltransferase 3B [Zootermopsis nevadensis]